MSAMQTQNATSQEYRMPDLERAKDRPGLLRFTPDPGGEGHGSGRTFYGHGAVFNRITRINSHEGLFDEQFAPGAFAKTIRERTPKFQFDHGQHPMIGSVPIGVITDIHEDTNGLYVEAQLGTHSNVDFIREAIESGAIDGMSIRFSVIREEWTDEHGNIISEYQVEQAITGQNKGYGTPLRTILEAKLDEVGPVVWPAYKDTTAAVRQLDPLEALIRQHAAIANPTAADQDRMLSDALAILRASNDEAQTRYDAEQDRLLDAAIAEVRAANAAHPPMQRWEDGIIWRHSNPSEVR